MATVKKQKVSIRFQNNRAALLALNSEVVKKELINSFVYYDKNILCMDLEFKSTFGIYIFGEIVGKDF